MEEEHIIEGPPIHGEIYEGSVGQRIFETLQKHSKLQHRALDDVTNNKSISFNELLQTTCKLAKWLARNGCKKNDLMTLCTENSIHFHKVVIAGLYNATTVAVINNNYTEDDLLHAMELVKPKIAFCSRATFIMHYRLYRRGKLSSVKHVFILEDIEKYIKDVKADPTNFKTISVNTREQPAIILYSSGTTGLSKAVVITHDNINTQIQISMDPLIAPIYPPLDGFLPLPFHHAYGFFISLKFLIGGQHLVFLQKFDFKLYLESVSKYKISTIFVVPALLVLFAKHPLLDEYNLSCIQEIRCGAAPLSKKIKSAVQKRLTNANITEGYGMTETTLGVIMHRIKDTRPPGAVGKVVPGIKIKIRDPESGKNLGPNSPGEVCAKGRLIMKGYYNNPAATSATIKDGWLMTGDVAYYDKEGYFYIVDRLKELIKYKGVQVAPAELESVLLSHPKIADAAVVGLPDEETGELPFAFVVKTQGADLTEKQVQEFVKGQVTSTKQLRGGVRFVDVIPKTPTGKILRKDLRKLLKNVPSKL